MASLGLNYSMDQRDLELRPATAAETLPQDDDASHPSFTLPRADGGKDAWLVLASCFVLEASVWGIYTRLSSLALDLDTADSHGSFRVSSGLRRVSTVLHDPRLRWE